MSAPLQGPDFEVPEILPIEPGSELTSAKPKRIMSVDSGCSATAWKTVFYRGSIHNLESRPMASKLRVVLCEGIDEIASTQVELNGFFQISGDIYGSPGVADQRDWVPAEYYTLTIKMGDQALLVRQLSSLEEDDLLKIDLPVATPVLSLARSERQT